MRAVARKGKVTIMDRRKIGRMLKVVLFSFLGVLGLIILAQLSLLAVMRPFVLPSGSMEPTILKGDHFFVLRRTFAGDIRRGDLVSFRYPVDPRQFFVKRVVGVPGDRVRLRDKQLFLNGHAVSEPYVEHTTGYIDAFHDNFPAGAPNVPHLFESAWKMLRENVKDGEVVVPPGNYFVLGDNRDNSLDSRHWGFVPYENMLGRPVYVYGPAPGGECRIVRRYPL